MIGEAGVVSLAVHIAAKGAWEVLDGLSGFRRRESKYLGSIHCRRNTKEDGEGDRR